MKLELTDVAEQERAATGEAAFVSNAFYERLIALRKTQPATFDSLAPASKLSLGYYEGAKRRHAMINDEASK